MSLEVGRLGRGGRRERKERKVGLAAAEEEEGKGGWGEVKMRVREKIGRRRR